MNGFWILEEEQVRVEIRDSLDRLIAIEHNFGSHRRQRPAILHQAALLFDFQQLHRLEFRGRHGFDARFREPIQNGLRFVIHAQDPKREGRSMPSQRFIERQALRQEIAVKQRDVVVHV